MRNNQFRLLNANLFVGLSFLAEGLDRIGLIIIGLLWLIFSIKSLQNE